MGKEKIWLSSPHMGENEQQFVNEAFDTNWIAPLGPHVNNFEKDLQEFNEVGHAAALSSGTAAIHLALILNDVGPGDLVFVQSFTFSATVNPILYQGAIPVLIDSEPGTWNMSAEHLEAAIIESSKFEVRSRNSREFGVGKQELGVWSLEKGSTRSGVGSRELGIGSRELGVGNVHPRTDAPAHASGQHTPASGGEGQPQLSSNDSRNHASPDFKALHLKTLQPKCILPVHLYGMPADMDAILEVGKKYGLPVIEDAAESLGSSYKGKMTGSLGQMGVYSFNGNKIITTSGGGALVSDDEAKIQHARKLATQARDPAPHYQHSEVGYNYRMSNVLAGIGRGQMQLLPERVKQRRANFERYREYFSKWNMKGFDVRFQEEQEGSYSNRWLTAILVDPERNKGLTREDIRLALEEENIEARPLWKPMHLQPVFEGFPFFGDGVSERLFEMGLCLPSGSNLSEGDFERIFGSLDGVFGSRE